MQKQKRLSSQALLGYLGNHLVRALLAQWHVRALVRRMKNAGGVR